MSDVPHDRAGGVKRAVLAMHTTEGQQQGDLQRALPAALTAIKLIKQAVDMCNHALNVELQAHSGSKHS